MSENNLLFSKKCPKVVLNLNDVVVVVVYLTYCRHLKRHPSIQPQHQRHDKEPICSHFLAFNFLAYKLVHKKKNLKNCNRFFEIFLLWKSLKYPSFRKSEVSRLSSCTSSSQKNKCFPSLPSKTTLKQNCIWENPTVAKIFSNFFCN
jgi:hypothetical protein